MNARFGACTAGLLALLLPATAPAFEWRLPPWLEPPPVPADNAMTAARVELGRHLFFNVHLSGPDYTACSHCHDPRHAFSDPRPQSFGVTGRRLRLNAPSLANVGYLSVLTRADPTVRSLEAHALRPLFSEEEEMAVAGREEQVLQRLRHDARFPALFRAAFPETGGEIDFASITRALAAFQRTLISADSPWDRHLHGGDPDALSAPARRGAALFHSERLGCAVCHGGPHFSDAYPEPRYHNTGLYNADGQGAVPEGGHRGLMEVTGRPEDMGRFRTPTLRNVAVTAPYMHDGSVPTLEAVIDHYAAGGRAALHGARSPLASERVRGFSLSATERADLLEFLHSLTDPDFLENPAIASPYRLAGQPDS